MKSFPDESDGRAIHRYDSLYSLLLMIGYTLMIVTGATLCLFNRSEIGTLVFCVAIFVFVLQKVSTLDEYYFRDSDIAALRRATRHLDEAWGTQEARFRTMLLSEPSLSEPLQHILDARFELVGLVDRVKEFR